MNFSEFVLISKKEENEEKESTYERYSYIDVHSRIQWNWMNDRSNSEYPKNIENIWSYYISYGNIRLVTSCGYYRSC